MAIPARELRALIAGLDDDTILCGPQGDPARILIDPVFAGRRADHLADLAADMGWRGEALHEGLARTLQSPPLAGAPEGFRFHPLTQEGWSHGLIAVSDAPSPRLAGFYAGCTLWVEPEMRGRGLGRALVASRLVLDGALPVWDHDKHGYSPEGAACHRAALRDLQPECGRAAGQPGLTG